MLGLLKAAWEPVHHARMVRQYRGWQGDPRHDPIAFLRGDRRHRWHYIDRREGSRWFVTVYESGEPKKKVVTSWEIVHVSSGRWEAGFD